MEVTIKARFKSVIPNSHWFQGSGWKPNVLSNHQGLSWVLSPGRLCPTLGTLKSSKSWVGCVSLGAHVCADGWSWGANSFSEEMGFTPHPPPPGCLPGHLILLETGGHGEPEWRSESSRMSPGSGAWRRWSEPGPAAR